LLNAILNELEGPRRIDAEDETLIGAWNALAEGRGVKAYIRDASHGEKGCENTQGRGIFLGVDSYGRALLETDRGRIELEAGAASLTFDPE
jgi:hypothetical protein